MSLVIVWNLSQWFVNDLKTILAFALFAGIKRCDLLWQTDKQTYATLHNTTPLRVSYNNWLSQITYLLGMMQVFRSLSGGLLQSQLLLSYTATATAERRCCWCQTRMDPANSTKSLFSRPVVICFHSSARKLCKTVLMELGDVMASYDLWPVYMRNQKIFLRIIYSYRPVVNLLQ